MTIATMNPPAVRQSKPSVAAPKVAPSKRLTAYTRHQGSDRPYANFYLAMCAAGDALERAKTAHVSDCDCDFCRELFGVGVLVELSDSILCAVATVDQPATRRSKPCLLGPRKQRNARAHEDFYVVLCKAREALNSALAEYDATADTDCDCDFCVELPALAHLFGLIHSTVMGCLVPWDKMPI